MKTLPMSVADICICLVEKNIVGYKLYDSNRFEKLLLSEDNKLILKSPARNKSCLGNLLVIIINRIFSSTKNACKGDKGGF